MDIYDVVEAQRAALLKREYRTVRDIVRAYEKAERSIEKAIRRYQAKIGQAQKTGTPISLAWVYQEVRLENILREIRLQLDEFSKDALEFSQAARNDAYQLGAVHALRLAEASVIGDIAGLHSGAFASAQSLLSAQSPLKDLFDKIAPMATEKARETFAEAIAQGWNPRKTGRVLKNRIENLTKERAILIARTEQIRAYRTANNDVYRRNSDVLRGWRWTSAKTPATCAMCLALDGTIFPVDQVLSSHPACRCSMVPLPRTDFGGPEPTLGEDYFAKLSPAEQDRILGKGKGKLYREGKMSLRDNVDFTVSPEWGRQPRPRRLQEIKDLHAKRRLPSQLGPVNLSGYTPPAARRLQDLLDSAERKANDPVQKALDAWDKAPSDARGRRVGLKADRSTYKKAAPKDLRASDLPSTIEEVDIKNLVASTQYPPDQKVRDYIMSQGDGPDLPLIVRQGARLWVHDNDSLARLEAKRLLGQEKANVRIFNADDFIRPVDPLQDIKDELAALGVKDIVIVDQTADARAALEWARDRIKNTGYAPKAVTVAGDRSTAAGGLVVGKDFRNQVKALTPSELRDKVDQSIISILDPKIAGNDALLSFKAQTYQAAGDVAEAIEAGLIRERLGLGRARGSKTLEDFAQKRGRLFSLKAFENSDIGEAVEEMIALYRRGEYVLGSLPDAIEGPTLKELRRIIGDRPVKTMSDSERVLGLQVGGQGGSNPGGMYLGVDGVKRYVKFYPSPDRAEIEHVANVFYKSLGIDVPETTLFQHQGKTAIASDVLEGRLVQDVGGLQRLTDTQVREVMDGYAMDAFLANWDVVGATADNLMIVGGKVYRIDNGGTFIFRAQGGDKADNILQKFDDWFSLGSRSSEGFSKYDGQLLPLVQRLGGARATDIEKDVLLPGGEKLLKWLNKTVPPKTVDKEAAWKRFILAQAPTISDQAATRMARMIEARTRLLAERIEFVKKGPKKVKVPKTLTALQKMPDAPFMLRTTDYAAYDRVIAEHIPKAHARAGKTASAAAYKYGGGSYKSGFNGPARLGQVNQDIIGLDKVIAANNEGAARDFRVIRYLDGGDTAEKWHRFTQADVGTVIADKAYISTSVREDFHWGGDTVLLIDVRRGEKRFTAPAASGLAQPHKNEHEFIFGRDIPLLIKKVEKRGGKTYITCEMIPENIKVDKALIKYALDTLRRWFK